MGLGLGSWGLVGLFVHRGRRGARPVSEPGVLVGWVFEPRGPQGWGPFKWWVLVLTGGGIGRA